MNNNVLSQLASTFTFHGVRKPFLSQQQKCESRIDDKDAKVEQT